MEVKKISRTILNVQKNLALKLHVKLISDDNGEPHGFHNEYVYNNTKYIRIDNMPFMTLDLIEKDLEWDKSKSIMITPMNIVHIIKAMERLLAAIYSDDIFAVNNQNKIVIYKDMVEKHTEKVFNLGFNHRLIMKPAIILDYNEVEIEGVVFYINNADNVVELSIDAFESLVYNIKNIDLFTYSQLLLNYFIIQENKEKQNNINTQPQQVKKQIIKRDSFNTSSCKAEGNLNRNRDSFDGLGKLGG